MNMRETCWKCAQRVEQCLCGLVTKFQTETHFVILIHPKEFKKEKIGTGRLTHSSLPNSSFIMGIDFTEDKQVNALLNDPKNNCVLLYPGQNAVATSELKPQESKRLVVFILDGTWACAKKMFNLSSNLHSLQKISIAPDRPSLFVIKQQPNSLCLSTMEAVVYVLKDLEKNQTEKKHDWDQMLTPFKKMVERQIEISNDPTRKSYRGKKGFDLDAIQLRAQNGTRKRKVI